MKVFYFKIIEWDKYNPRKDLVNPVWFRINNDFFLNPKVMMLPLKEKLLLVFLLCEATTKKGKGHFFDKTANLYLGGQYNYTKSLQIIQDAGIISFSTICTDAEQTCTDPEQTCALHNITLHNITKQLGAEKVKKAEKESEVIYKNGKLILTNTFTDQLIKVYTSDIINSELIKMEEWLIFNKPKKNYKSFITGWLRRGYPDFKNKNKEKLNSKVKELENKIIRLKERGEDVSKYEENLCKLKNM